MLGTLPRGQPRLLGLQRCLDQAHRTGGIGSRASRHPAQGRDRALVGYASRSPAARVSALTGDDPLPKLCTPLHEPYAGIFRGCGVVGAGGRRRSPPPASRLAPRSPPCSLRLMNPALSRRMAACKPAISSHPSPPLSVPACQTRPPRSASRCGSAATAAERLFVLGDASTRIPGSQASPTVSTAARRSLRHSCCPRRTCPPLATLRGRLRVR